MSFNVVDYQNFLREKFFLEKYDEFNNKLIETEGIIAGSSVLSVYQNFSTTREENIDLDIYIHISKAKILVDFLRSNGWELYGSRNYITPEYDESFFKKNNILGRFRLFNNNYKNLDILIIADEHMLENIVKNFDLSICEIWYDGRTVQYTDESGINNKITTLRKEYIPALLNMNKFTLNRIKKYENRGFKIKINTIDEVTYLEKPKKTVSNPEEWAVLKVYKNLLFNFNKNIINRMYSNLSTVILEDIDYFNNFYNKFVNISFNLFVKYPLTNFTTENLNILSDQLLGIGNLRELSRKKIRRKFYSIILAEDYYEYKYYPKIYKNYFKQYLNVKMSDIRKENEDYEYDDEDDEDDEDEDDDEDDEDDNEDEDEDEEVEHNRNIGRNMERIREIEERERQERERQVREIRQERQRQERERQERERQERQRQEREAYLNTRRGILQELENFPEPDDLIREILDDPSDYATEVIRQIIKDHYIGLVNRVISQNNLNITDDFIQRNSNNILELKGFLQYYYQRKYYFEKINEIIEELREYNPRNLNIADFENLITEVGINNDILKNEIEKYYSYQNFEVIGPENEDEIEVPINFEGIDFDESRLKNTCQDLIMFDEKEITEHLNEEGAIILINRGSGNDSDILCFDRETLLEFFNNRNDGWFYACTGKLMWNTKRDNKYKVMELSNDRSISDRHGNLNIFHKPYVKVPINAEGMNAFISAQELYSMIHSDKNVFYIEPKLDERGNQISFTHTITNGVAEGGSFVSANHCQSGSNVLLYEIKICNNPELCIRSIVQ